ncbi:hypothetical protein F4777DRAFT_574246 [Nemania sp. FL0916]|nr:hypothetical protein F4777DRAFT_574246 [Nemania sp. FL0916]
MGNVISTTTRDTRESETGQESALENADHALSTHSTPEGEASSGQPRRGPPAGAAAGSLPCAQTPSPARISSSLPSITATAVAENPTRRDGETLQSAIIINSDNDDDDDDDKDLFTLLHKHRRSVVNERTPQIKHEDDYKSLNILPPSHLESSGKGSEKSSKASLRSRHREFEHKKKHKHKHKHKNKYEHSVDDKHRNDAPKTESREIRDATLRPGHSLSFPSREGIHSPRKDIRRNAFNTGIQKRTKCSHKGKNNKLAPFRRVNERFIVRNNDAIPKPHLRREPQQNDQVVAKIDSGQLTSSIHPAASSGADTSRSQRGRLPIPIVAVNQVQGQQSDVDRRNLGNLGNLFKNFSQFQPAHPQLDESALALAQQRPREYVASDCAWAYTVKCLDGSEIILEDDDVSDKAIALGVFADREKANAYLDKGMSVKDLGGLDAIMSRTVTLEGAERLLRVEVVLANGVKHQGWVERGVKTLKTLKKKERMLVRWQPKLRPKFTHYVVSCDLLTYDTSTVVYCEDSDSDEDVAAGIQVTPRIEKTHVATFTLREMANEDAGKVFLYNSAVPPQFAQPKDVWWWQHNALPEHKRALDAVRETGGLYEAKLKAYDMNTRLGWDEIVVRVHEVSDVQGPVNF